MQRRLSGSRRHRTKPAFQRGNPFFQHSHGRVRYPRIDVPRTFQIEQCRGVIRVLKNVGGGLVNRLRPRAGGGIGLLARVQAKRGEFKQFRVDHESSHSM